MQDMQLLRFLVRLLRALEYLVVKETNVKDLEPIAPLTNLKYLNIIGTKAKDLQALCNLYKIEEIELSSTETESIDILLRLPNLKGVVIDTTSSDRSVPDEVMRPLREQGIQVTNRIKAYVLS